MNRRDALNFWQQGEIMAAKEKGELMFMGFPDAWYESATYACENGHISHQYLKTEAGYKCLACKASLFLVPPNTTETTLSLILDHSEAPIP